MDKIIIATYNGTCWFKVDGKRYTMKTLKNGMTVAVRKRGLHNKEITFALFLHFIDERDTSSKAHFPKVTGTH